MMRGKVEPPVMPTVVWAMLTIIHVATIDDIYSREIVEGINSRS
jgi:hypothetical protein